MKTLYINAKWFAGTLASLLISAQAQALTLDPSDAVASTSDNSNLTTLSEINSAFGTSYADLMLLWKGETDSGSSGQDGSLTGSYEWNVGSTAKSGTIDYVAGEAAASCPTCLLVVKGSNSQEAQHLYDLEEWDGNEQIAVEEEGDISNVAIWGGVASVSEPGTLVLMSLGLLGLTYSRKRRLI
jgi:hypothetical protein